MPARLKKFHSDEVRAKIQASQLVNILQQASEGEIEISAVRLGAINSLLDRSLAKLSQVEHVGDANRPLSVVHKIELIAL